MVEFRRVNGGVTAPQGFKATGIHCGLKEGQKDLALIYSENLARAAGTFTTNKIKAAPVLLSMRRVKGGLAQAILINSGYANACTGRKGLRDARKMAELVAKELGIESQYILIASTGVIGQLLPMERIEKGIKELVRSLSYRGGKEAAKAIMTTDTFPKETALEAEIGGKKITIGGMAKGAGMISPQMATMLSFITTDAKIGERALKKALKDSVMASYNMITVDGDMSTNDMVLILANGLAENSEIMEEGEGFQKFKALLDNLNLSLARLIVKDGEGATKFVEVEVKNAATPADAKKVAFAIAQSNLVKTALFGEDPNWGRVMAAIGYSQAKIKPGKIKVYFGEEQIVDGGERSAFSEAKVRQILKDQEIRIVVDLGLGRAEGRVWTCDLSYNYIKVNAHYRT